MEEKLTKSLFNKYFIHKERQGDVAVLCKTEEIANQFIKIIYDNNLIWWDGDCYTCNYYEDYENDTCYCNDGTYCDLDFALDEDMLIFEFDEKYFI